jgi:low density lipoprotein-related protein 2
MGRIYWTDGGSGPKIETASMDVSNRRVLVMGRLGVPISLTINAAMNHALFRADFKVNVIERANRYGSTPKVVVGGRRARQAIKIDVFESWIYWF